MAGRHVLALENGGPAEHRVQRIAQLVRERRQELVLDLVAAFGLGARGAFAGQQLFALGDIGGDGDARAVAVFGHDAPLDFGDAAVGPQDRHGAFPAAAVRERDVQLSCTSRDGRAR